MARRKITVVFPSERKGEKFRSYKAVANTLQAGEWVTIRVDEAFTMNSEVEEEKFWVCRGYKTIGKDASPGYSITRNFMHDY